MKNIVKEDIKNYIDEIKSIIETISLDHFEQDFIEINSNEFPKPELIRSEINETPLQEKLNKLFLGEKESPYIYWFEYESENSKKKILDAIKVYANLANRERKEGKQKSELKYYKTPAIKVKTSSSKCLYVGKVNRDLIGRLQPHFGFYIVSPNTSGLQLRYWAKDLDLKIKLHYIKLPKELVGFTGFLERKLASDLKPIIGKHRS